MRDDTTVGLEGYDTSLIKQEGDQPEPLELWNPHKLDHYEVEDYLSVAKKYFSLNL